MNREPDGPYVIQKFGPVTHPQHQQAARLWGVSGLHGLTMAKIEGLTKTEAEACCLALRRLYHLPDEPSFIEMDDETHHWAFSIGDEPKPTLFAVGTTRLASGFCNAVSKRTGVPCTKRLMTDSELAKEKCRDLGIVLAIEEGRHERE